MQLINEFQKEVLAKVGKKKYTLCTGGRGIGSSYALALAARAFKESESEGSLVIYLSSSTKGYVRFLKRAKLIAGRGVIRVSPINYNVEGLLRGYRYDSMLVVIDNLSSYKHHSYHKNHRTLMDYLEAKCPTEVKYLVFNSLEDLRLRYNLWSACGWLKEIGGRDCHCLEDKLVKRGDVTLIVSKVVEDSPRAPLVLTI